MKKLVAWLLALLLLVSSTFALADEETTLTVGTTTAMSGSFMNGMFGSNTADMDVRKLLHGYSLTQWDAEAGTYVFNDQVIARVTKEVVDGKLRFNMYIRSDLKYSDGSAITAKDYAFTILLALCPQMQELGVSAAGFADQVLGSREYSSGENFSLRGLRVKDNNHLILTMESGHQPDFYDLSLLCFEPLPIKVIAPGCRVVDGELGCSIGVWDKHDEGITAQMLAHTLFNEADGYVSHPTVVSGPYTLVSYDAAASVAEFARNPYYEGNSDGEMPLIDRIIYKLVANEDVVSMLRSGEIDLVNKAAKASTIDAALALVAEGVLASTAYPRSGLSMVAFACEQDAVADAAVRQAIAHCFDKEAFIAAYLGDYGAPVEGYYGIGQWMYAAAESTLAEMTRYAPDTAAAAALLDAAGWALNADGLRAREVDGRTVVLDLKLLYPAGNEVGPFLTGSFTDALSQVGIRLTVEAKPFAELLQVYYRQVERDADMIYLATNFGQVYDPSVSFDPADAYQGLDNRTGIQDEALYQLAVDMRRTQPGDTLTYLEKWLLFQERWVEVLPAIPVYSGTYYDFYTTRLHGYDVASEQTWAEAIIGAELAQ